MNAQLFLTIAGLAFCCGLRAFPTVLFLALGKMWGLWKLNPQVAFITSNEALLILGALSALEILGDKSKSLDALMDMAHLFIRPLAGAFCIFAIVKFPHPLHNYIFSLLISGFITLGVHTHKGGLKEAAPSSVLAIFSPVMSLVEDGLALAGFLLLRLSPPLAFPLLLVVFLVAMHYLRKWKTALIETYTATKVPRNPLLEYDPSQAPRHPNHPSF